jgi:RNA polymerase sigma factor (sigma-70 family)
MTSSVALERLYDRHADRLLRFFVRRTADPQVAADLWAETFAQTVSGHRLRRALSGDDERDAALLYAIARRQLALYYRRGYAEQRAMQKLGLERPAFGEDPAAQFEHLVDLDELREVVGGAVAQIPDGLSEAVRLRVVDQCSYADVAATLAISEQAARARVSRGLKALAHLLQQEAPISPATGQEHA